VLGFWLSFEPNSLDGKDSEFVDDKARASTKKGASPVIGAVPAAKA